MRRTILLVLLVALAACQQDKGDPVKISRDFMVGVWTGDVHTVKKLTCEEWRSVSTEWAQGGDSTLTVDTGELRLEVLAEADDQVDIRLSGRVSFTSAEGQTEVRNLDTGEVTYIAPDGQTTAGSLEQKGTIRFTLIDEEGWKVCGVR